MSNENEDRLTLPQKVDDSNRLTSPHKVDDANSIANVKENQLCRHPWPHLEKFFAFKYCRENNAVFSCMLCLPKEIIIKGHRSSLSNLKAHIRRKHNSQYIQFDNRVKAGSRRGHHTNLVNNRANSDSFKLKDTQDKNCVGMFQKTEINSGNEVEDSNNLENCFAFVNVNQIKTENDDQLDIHDEPIQTFSQHSSDTYSETMENSFYLGGKRENSVSPSASQEPEQKKIKNSFMERTDEIISVINRLEKVLISETNRRQEGDLFDVFGRSVSDQLRQLPRRQAIMAQSKIQNLLIQEFLEYENLNTSKTHE
ncbi:UNVERIFIED_CONTAM: hypothetical protein RMT77_008017 [Armadillidium vulgare]